MITLTVHYPTEEFLQFLQQQKFSYSVETIASYPNPRTGRYDLGIIHVDDYPGNLYDGIIGLGCYWHKEGIAG
jgi:hypothetical protein